MSAFTPAGSGGQTGSGGGAGESGKTSPTIYTVNMPVAGVEYPFVLPVGFISYLVIEKTELNAKLRIAYLVGGTAVDYLPIPPNNWYSEESVDNDPANKTLHIQSNKTATAVAILVWL